MNRYTLLMTISEVTGIETNAICGKRRNKEIVTARHLFFYFGRVYFGLRLVEMAALVGCHHASVIHAIDKVSDMIETCEETYCRYFEAIRAKINTERELILFVPYTVNLAQLYAALSEFDGIRVTEKA